MQPAPFGHWDDAQTNGAAGQGSVASSSNPRPCLYFPSPLRRHGPFSPTAHHLSLAVSHSAPPPRLCLSRKPCVLLGTAPTRTVAARASPPLPGRGPGQVSQSFYSLICEKGTSSTTRLPIGVTLSAQGRVQSAPEGMSCLVLGSTSRSLRNGSRSREMVSSRDRTMCSHPARVGVDTGRHS